MNKIFSQITDFVAGELTPLVDGRVDIAKYFHGAKTLVNMLVHPHGGISRRPGTRYLGAAKYNDVDARLIPFEFRTEQTYILEFGDCYIRFFKDQGQIVDPTHIVNGTFDADIDDWDNLSTAPSAISWNAASLAMDLYCDDPAIDEAWAEQDVANLGTQVARILSFDVAGGTVEMLVGSATGLDDINAASVCSIGSHSITVAANDYSTHYIGFKAGAAGATSTVDTVGYAGTYYEVWSPYAAAHLSQLYYAQTADTIYLAHPNYAPRKLVRSDHDDWSLTEIEFGPKIEAPASITLTNNLPVARFTHQYAITAWAPETGESDPLYSNRVSNYLLMTETFWHRLVWPSVEGAEKYFIYKYDTGLDAFGLMAVAAPPEDTVGSLYDTGLWEINADETIPIAVDPFISVDNYPAVVGFYEQRSVWGGSNIDPNKFWISRTASPEDLTSGVVTDDGFSFRIAGDFNKLRWIASMKTLLFGSAGGEGRIASDAIGEPLSTDNAFIRRETNYGAEPVMPILIGNSVVYVQRLGRKLREYTYNSELESWGSEDLTLLSEHLTNTENAGTILELAYAKEPTPIIWARRSDGDLLGLTYDRTQDVFAWHRHQTDGLLKSVAVIPGSDRSETYFLISRTIDGTECRFIELLESTEFENMEDYWGVDSGLQYSEVTSATIITGLDHLAGASAVAFANGLAIDAQTVSAGGTIALANSATLVTAGLAYTGTFQSMRQEFASRSGTSQGKMKKIISVIVRVFRSAGFKIGCTAQTNQNYPVDVIMDEVTFDLEADGRPEGDVGDPLGETNALWSCDKDVVPEGGWNRDGYIWIQAADPSPLHILGIYPRMGTGGM